MHDLGRPAVVSTPVPRYELISKTSNKFREIALKGSAFETTAAATSRRCACGRGAGLKASRFRASFA